jgi:uncharacterized protein (TIGR00255 family)
MIKSMTGFGKSQAVFGLKTLTIDVRALNSKQLDLNIRIPNAFREKEAEIRSRVSAILERGKVDVFVSLKSQLGNSGVSVNSSLVKARYAELLIVAKELNVDTSGLFSDVLRFPDLIQEEEMEAGEMEWEIIRNSLMEAINQVDQFRFDEGKGLASELIDRVHNIEQLLIAITPHEESRMVHVRARLKQKIDELLSQVDANANRFEEEMIYFMEKLDITEEKQRLLTHCTYFRETAAEKTASGRKLAFISQEMGR